MQVGDDTEAWKWAMTNEVLDDNSYTNWADGEPNRADEKCAIFHTEKDYCYGGWLDIKCEYGWFTTVCQALIE